ncbi:putative RDD family membrane protein YckC [Prosthecobacter fusiformis]|uniref:Putative RDD family membrane protein YckC n=1 Tax=Prosthecobacter fusiformis TaxID=48464 RepID=A0A4R7RY37_9BACT|nr:RDD family protein [Prosthecobacter fusiformis]TDU70762.1 putative RDD family membrane protein YckC [Prosthecobacter fusiformis]
MSEINPYAPPQADLTPEVSSLLGQPLASPWIRLVAQLVDGLISAAVLLPLMYFSGYWARAAESVGQSFVESLLWAPVQLAIMIGINWTFLLQGQTIGKKLLKVRIVRKDGSPIDRTRIITHRLLPVWVVSNIPVVNLALIADALCIFRAGRNTLHDDIADTKVVVA